MTTLPPLSLYVHIPWCEKKCPYCDFNSHAAGEIVPESEYIQALLADLHLDLNWVHGRELVSVFIGGGTPSLFTGESISDLLAGIGQILPLKKGLEVTLEANPGSSEVGKFVEFRQAGVNRLSIGIQSFNNDSLERLGRVHTASEACNAVSAAGSAGFDSYNLDLMYGLPDQDLEASQEDLGTAIKLGPPHLSCYQLTIEPNTSFHHRPPVLPSDDETWSMQTGLQSILAESGYGQYEVSAYARPGQECIHNLNYWQFGDYLGIGAGAHGKVTTPDLSVARYWKQKHPARYLQSAASESRVGGITTVRPADLPLEFMMNALRLKQGFSRALFEKHTGISADSIANTIARQCDKGLISVEGGLIRPTDLGYRFVNSMLDDYL